MNEKKRMNWHERIDMNVLKSMKGMDWHEWNDMNKLESMNVIEWIDLIFRKRFGHLGLF
jgi:hypothetical protein